MPDRSHFRTLAAASLLAVLATGSAAAGPADLPAEVADQSPEAASPRLDATMASVLAEMGIQVAPTAVSGKGDPFAALGPAGYAAFATGTVYDTDPELGGKTDDEDAVGQEVRLAMSDAAHASAPLGARRDELGRQASPALAAGVSFARALGVDLPEEYDEFDLGDFDPDPAEATAPPTASPVRKQTSVTLPFLQADSFSAEASARSQPAGCVIGDSLAVGSASATRTGTVADGPLRAVLAVNEEGQAFSQSFSRVALTPAPVRPGTFGVVAETQQTIAPVSFGLPGSEDTYTIEIGGPWRLAATVTGAQGSYDFGPVNEKSDYPAARLLLNGKPFSTLDYGDIVPLVTGNEVVGELRVGDEPRAIGSLSGTDAIQRPTRVSAAADAVVVEYFPTGSELRIGHMEVDVAVPVGGVACPGIGVHKTTQPERVRAGDRFSWTIEITNPNDCTLDDLVVQDTPATGEGVDWKVTTTDPRAKLARDGSLTFDKIPALRGGETRRLRINAEVAKDSKSGTITNQARAVGACSAAPVTGAAPAVATTVEALPPPPPPPPPPVVVPPAANVPGPVPAPEPSVSYPGTGSAGGGRFPAQVSVPAPQPAGLLPRTGGPLPLAIGVAATALGLGLRRLRRRST